MVERMAEQWDDCWTDMMVTMTDEKMGETMGVRRVVPKAG
jgi:hypothetical protein